jgi:plastocyanin
VKKTPIPEILTAVLIVLVAACGSESSGRFPTGLVPPPAGSPPSEAFIRFERTGYPNSWEVVGVAGTTLSDHTFPVFAHNGVSPVSGLRIVWAVSGTGGSITPTNDTTTASGRSAATLTLGPEEGGYTVTATAPTLPGAPQFTFKATAVSLMVGVRDSADGGFVPAKVTVTSGHSVGWRYESGDGTGHDVTFEDDPTRPVSSDDMWDLWAGVRYHTRVFDGSPRTIRYRCKDHSTSFADGEVGTVTVK